MRRRQFLQRTLAAVRSGDLGEVEAVMDEHLGQLERTWEEETARALIRPMPDFLLHTRAHDLKAHH